MRTISIEEEFQLAFLSSISDQATIYRINQWVSDHTRGKITNLLRNFSGKESEMVCQICVNALYANGKWDRQFSKKETEKKEFRGTEGSRQVDMMHADLTPRDAGYLRGDNFEAVSLVLGGTSTVTFVLPSADLDVIELAGSLTYDKLKNKNWVAANVDLSLPRFKVEASANLNYAMKELGLDFAVPSENALFDLGGKEEIRATEMIQKTSLTINEEGAEMAASTTLTIFTDNGVSPEMNVKVEFNRPFLFFVTEEYSGAMLLAGCVSNIL